MKNVRRQRLDVTLTTVFILGLVSFFVVCWFIYCRNEAYVPNRTITRSELQCGDLLLTVPRKGMASVEHRVRQLAMRSIVLHVAVVLDKNTLYESTGKGGAGAQIISLNDFLERRSTSFHVYVRQLIPRLSPDSTKAMWALARRRVGTPYDYSIWSLTVDPLLPPHALAMKGGLYCTSAVWEALQAAKVLEMEPTRKKLVALDHFASWNEGLLFAKGSGAKFAIEKELVR